MRLLLAVLLLVSVSGCDALQDIVDPPSDADLDGLAIASTGDAEMPYVAIHENGEMMAIEVDPASGALVRATMQTPDGVGFSVSFGADGMPTRMTVGGMVVVIANVRPTMADLVAIAPDGTSTVIRDVTIDAAAAREMRAYAQAARLGQSSTMSELFNAAALGVGITGCTMVGAGVFALTVGVTGPLAPQVGVASSTACLSTIASIVALHYARNGNNSQELEDTSNAFSVVGTTVNLALCRNLDYRACTELVATLLGGIASATEQTELAVHPQITDAEALLLGGGGDVQISLRWNTTADLDLWVTDPFGERIYYGNRTSTSGGRLDVDDTDGEGPENVFWALGTAPPGVYHVEVDHFSGASPSEWRVVTVVNGRTLPFEGVISTGQTWTATQFAVGATRDASPPAAVRVPPPPIAVK